MVNFLFQIKNKKGCNKMEFCDYKNSLGEPKRGIHAERIDVFGLSLAKNDVVATIGLGILLGLISGGILSNAMNLQMSIQNTIIFWFNIFIFCVIFVFLFGIYAHWLFCVETELNKFLGM